MKPTTMFTHKRSASISRIFVSTLFWVSLASSSFAQSPLNDQDNKAFAALTDAQPFTLDPQTGKHGFWWLPSTDVTPYYIRYDENIFFKIQRNNLTRLMNTKEGVVFIAEMFYPTFAGATAETLKEFDFHSWDQSPHIIMISGPFKDNGHPNKNMWSWENFAEKHQKQYGLMKANHNKNAPDLMYFVDDPQLGKVIIQCNAPGHFAPECTVYWNMTDDLNFMYHYHRDLLPQWRAIHEHVIDFINSSRRGR